jgi:hypothetical protein
MEITGVCSIARGYFKGPKQYHPKLDSLLDFTGWGYTYPSEKYESMGRMTSHMENKIHVTTNQIIFVMTNIPNLGLSMLCLQDANRLHEK